MERYNSPAAGTSEQHRTVQQGMESIEQGQQSIAQAVQSPIRQAVDLQKDMAKILMSGLELTESTQRIGLDMTRSLSQNYLKAIEETMKGLNQATQGGGASMHGGGQQQRQPPNGGGQFQQTGAVGQAPQAPPAPAPAPAPPAHGYQQQYQPQPPLRDGQGAAMQENQMPPQQFQNQPPE